MNVDINTLIKSIVIFLVCGSSFCQENPVLPGQLNNEGSTGGMPMSGPGTGLFGGMNPFLQGGNEQPTTLPMMPQGSRFDMTPYMLGIVGARDGINPFTPGQNELNTGMPHNIPGPNFGSVQNTFGRSPTQSSIFSNVLKGVPKADMLIFYRILNPEFASENAMLSKLFCMRCLGDNNLICMSMYCSPE